jgi:hypothetical protein
MSYTSLLNPRTNLSKYLQIIPMESLSVDANNIINRVSCNDIPDKSGEGPQIFGSFVYKAQKYPGDIDLLEYINGRNIPEVVKIFMKCNKIIVTSVLKYPQEWFSEMKAGLDTRYDIDIGECDQGVWQINRNLKLLTEEYLDVGLFNEKEATLILSSIAEHQVINQDDYDIVHSVFRERKILRWTAKEILKKKKILPLDQIMSLEKAILMDTLLKIDVINIIDGRFVEVTNAFHLTYGINEIPLGHVPDIPNDLMNEIEKLYYSNFHYNAFKCMKRMYSWARNTQNTKLVSILSEFISSNTSEIYQMASEISTIYLIVEKYYNPSRSHIFETLDRIRQRLIRIVDLSPEVINQFYYLLEKYDYGSGAKANQKGYKIKKHRRDQKMRLEALKDMTVLLKKETNRGTIQFFNFAGINPPSKVIPFNKRTYEEIIREPNDNPKIS